MYGVLDTGFTVLGQPRFAGEYVVYLDPNDGWWVISDMRTAGSRRVNPFPPGP